MSSLSLRHSFKISCNINQWHHWFQEELQTVHPSPFPSQSRRASTICLKTHLPLPTNWGIYCFHWLQLASTFWTSTCKVVDFPFKSIKCYKVVQSSKNASPVVLVCRGLQYCMSSFTDPHECTGHLPGAVPGCLHLLTYPANAVNLLAHMQSTSYFKTPNVTSLIHRGSVVWWRHGAISKQSTVHGLKLMPQLHLRCVQLQWCWLNYALSMRKIKAHDTKCI